jgi:hypothetical protein
MVQQLYEKMLNLTNHQGNSNQSHNEMLYYSSKNAFYQKDDT